MLAREIDRLEPVAGLDDVVTVGFKQIVEELHIELIVFHDQHRLRHNAWIQDRRSCGRSTAGISAPLSLDGQRRSDSFRKGKYDGRKTRLVNDRRRRKAG